MIKSFNILTTTILLTVGGIVGNAQEQEIIKRQQLFDYSWKFTLGDDPTASAKDFDDKSWRTLDLPHDWSIEGKLNPKNPTGGGGGYFLAGIGWYHKTFKAPSAWQGKRVSMNLKPVPIVEITEPEEGSIFEPGESVLLKARASASADARVLRVEFLIDGVSVGVDSEPPYEFNCQEVKKGRHVVTVKSMTARAGRNHPLR